MEKSNFNRLMKRYVTGQVSDEERKKIEAWLEVIKTDDTTGLELSKADEDRLFNTITANKDNIREIEAFAPEKPKRMWLVRVAAGIALLLAVSYGIRVAMRENMNGDSGDVRKMILSDGSLVWLRGQSRLDYSDTKQDGIRYATLEGEALFEIAKDPSHPFVIQCGLSIVRVVGTSFSLRSAHDSLELKVLTGKVIVSLPQETHLLEVLPNEKVFYAGKGAPEKTLLAKKEITGTMAGTEYNMQFRDASLSEVVASLARKFNMQVDLAEKTTGDCRITVDLTDHSLQNSLQLITEVLEIKYTQEGGTIVISGTGCR